MILLELFAGTRSISKAFEKEGFATFSVEWDRSFKNISLYKDVEELTTDDILTLCGGKPDVIWASPDCTTYSIAAISHYRVKTPLTLEPKTEYAKKCDRTNKHVLELIKALEPKYWFIENPRGGLRKMDFMQGLPRFTVTYCQYGDSRMKPTDIFTNYKNPNFAPCCRNGDKCHVSAPRGSRSGTQGLRGHIERSKIPEKLCQYIARICKI